MMISLLAVPQKARRSERPGHVTLSSHQAQQSFFASVQKEINCTRCLGVLVGNDSMNTIVQLSFS